MPGTNYRPQDRVSWWTNKPTQPSTKCVHCKKAEATQWVAYDYLSGKKMRICTGYRAVCGEACSKAYCDRMNRRAARAAAKPLSLREAIAEALRPQPTDKPNPPQTEA